MMRLSCPEVRCRTLMFPEKEKVIVYNSDEDSKKDFSTGFTTGEVYVCKRTYQHTSGKDISVIVI
jgi:hypothetical protein